MQVERPNPTAMRHPERSRSSGAKDLVRTFDALD
jgi:hypothetical protein